MTRARGAGSVPAYGARIVVDTTPRARPADEQSWPPAFFASAPGDGVSIAEQADELLREGFGR